MERIINGYSISVVVIDAPNIVYQDGAKRGCHTQSTFVVTDFLGQRFEGGESPKGGGAWTLSNTDFEFTRVEKLGGDELRLVGKATERTERYDRLFGFVGSQEEYPVDFVLKRVS